ncbi:hypothetical protein [Streptomyces flaveolus]|uniref:hypothetical protein n=1 Tax=Streptomyces flaveolus TaxID=67297 RepID=UPI0033193BEE
MAEFPSGNFTIVNQETGRCVRVRLGDSADVSDHRLGNTYLMSRTDPPTLELGPADGTMATAWYYQDGYDTLERQSFSQIASTAVRELQNIGNYCVWLYSEGLPSDSERRQTQALFANMLNDVPADLGKRLDPLIPEEWMQQAEEAYAAELPVWKSEGDDLLSELEQLNARQATLLDELRPQHAALFAALRAHTDELAKAIETHSMVIGYGDGRKASAKETQDRLEGYVAHATSRLQQLEEKMEHAPPQDQERLLQEQLEVITGMFGGQVPSMTKEVAYVLKHLELTALFEKELKKALSTEEALAELLKAEGPVRAWQRRAPLKGVARWNDRCATLQVLGSKELDGVDKRFVEAMNTYLAEAAKGGVTVPGATVSSRTGMFGCGAMRGENSTYRWRYDGTYIYGADDRTVPAEQTYWTDEDGRLVGKSKGGAGQKWKIAPWTEPPKTSQYDVSDVYLTGFFGPLSRFFRGA